MGGTPTLLRLFDLAAVAAVLYLLRQRRDWIASAGWATLALLMTLAWLMPWYVIWVAPLAALGSSVRLRRATLVFTLFIMLTFLPAVTLYLSNHGINGGFAHALHEAMWVALGFLAAVTVLSLGLPRWARENPMGAPAPATEAVAV